MKQSFEDAVFTSTFYDPRWSTNNILRSYQLEYPDGSLEDRIDYSDWRLTSMLKRIKNYIPSKYKGEKFTTLVYNAYGTTTIYRIVLMFNGFMHPYEIEIGETIKYPYPSELNNLITNLNISKNKSAGRSVPI